jgi:hypothetical protein
MILQLRAQLLIWSLKLIVRTLFTPYSKFLYTCVDPLDCVEGNSFDCSFARKLVDKFLKDHETALTPYGYNIFYTYIDTCFCHPNKLNLLFFQNVSLQSLQEKLSESNLHVIFWNKQFHTAIKRKNRIYVLDPNLSSFDAREIWRCLETVDGPGATLATIRGEHKCNSPDCQLAFTSSFNLKRHNYVHPTSSGSKELDILKHRAEFGNCWDSASYINC